MKLNQLQELQELKGLSGLSNLTSEARPIKNKYFSSIDALCYGANLCYIAHRILEDEIKVTDRYKTVDALMSEAIRTSKPDFINELYTPTTAKKFYKSVGIKPRHQK